MARQPRFILPNYPQHIIIRGINRENIFLTEKDYRFYLSILDVSLKKHRCSLHAYVLMKNHVHLLVSPECEYGISKMVQLLGRYYVHYFNDIYRRTGTLWEGRYKAALVDPEFYLLLCYRYIELNPVRNKTVECPSEYRWSSYSYNALGKRNTLITPHDSYLKLAGGVADRCMLYTNMFNEGITADQLALIRGATNTGWVLGGQDFRDRIEKLFSRRTAPLHKGGDRKSAAYRKNKLVSEQSC